MERGYLVLSVIEDKSVLNDCWVFELGGETSPSFYNQGNGPRGLAELWPDTLISGSGQVFCPLAIVRHYTRYNPSPPARLP